MTMIRISYEKEIRIKTLYALLLKQRGAFYFIGRLAIPPLISDIYTAKVHRQTILNSSCYLPIKASCLHCL